jgi:hypothetical protein
MIDFGAPAPGMWRVRLVVPTGDADL